LQTCVQCKNKKTELITHHKIKKASDCRFIDLTSPYPASAGFGFAQPAEAAPFLPLPKVQGRTGAPCFHRQKGPMRKVPPVTINQQNQQDKATHDIRYFISKTIFFGGLSFGVRRRVAAFQSGALAPHSKKQPFWGQVSAPELTKRKGKRANEPSASEAQRGIGEIGLQHEALLVYQGRRSIFVSGSQKQNKVPFSCVEK